MYNRECWEEWGKGGGENGVEVETTRGKKILRAVSIAKVELNQNASESGRQEDKIVSAGAGIVESVRVRERELRHGVGVHIHLKRAMH